MSRSFFGSDETQLVAKYSYIFRTIVWVCLVLFFQVLILDRKSLVQKYDRKSYERHMYVQYSRLPITGACIALYGQQRRSFTRDVASHLIVGRFCHYSGNVSPVGLKDEA